MKKIDWTNHIIEFITVVIGIGLAFALNNWNENKKEIKQADLFLQSIEEEIKINWQEIEEKLAYHQQLMENLEKKPAETILIIKPSRIEDHAWEIANNNIFKQHTEFHLYKKLSKIYSIQEVLERHNSHAGQMMAQLSVNGPFMMIPLYNDDFSEEDEIAFRSLSRQSWIPIFEDMVFYESELIKLYEEVLEKM
ncbi:MAG: hypothetical protein AAFZ15_13415 [Bacteroidota bacterium]